ncbi:hypothetical protein JUJ52_03070 [Virgibacillus sp. AGTR]|uniref:hypothetical protein n=1 Tax=Virgibacillus sp. AGTR TaxID=2812055 RepID=UPI001D15EDC6|nr:hypothetical protein [Virgibacillus sp. AGTR]MCC2248939.1 hypothetical protein [Virgibacillus sp. AGTR]
MVKQRREQMGVQPGDEIVLKGTVTFARLDKPVTGEALVQENNRRARLGMSPIDEFRSITIENPEIVQGEGTPLANFHAQGVYQAKGTGKPTMGFESKSLYPPKYGHMQEDGSVQEIPDPQKNPSPGQVVYLLIRAYGKKGYNNLGSTFDNIVFAPGEINFYEGRGNGLEGFGKAMNMPVHPIKNDNTQNQPVQENVDQKQLVGAGAGQGQGFGGFSQAPAGDPNQPETNQDGFAGFGQANGATNNPFGVQEGTIPNQGSPFGNSGQRGKSPYA